MAKTANLSNFCNPDLDDLHFFRLMMSSLKMMSSQHVDVTSTTSFLLVC